MMWASLLLAGILSGWWGALALAAAPPANRNSLEKTSTRTTSDHPPSMTIIAAVENSLDHSLPTWNFVARTLDDRGFARSPRDRRQPVLSASPLSLRVTENDNQPGKSRSWRYPPEKVVPVPTDDQRDSTSLDDDVSQRKIEELLDDSIRDVFVSTSKQAYRRLEDRRPEDAIVHPKTDESGLTRLPGHSSTQTPFLYSHGGNESSMERPRAIRSTKQRPKNRTKADSPREQRRRCRTKGCRGQNWCPDVDVGNRAYLAPTVFEGKVRSMSSARKPGSNYAVTFEVKQVYKSQPGFQPLQKNDSVRLHFRDKSAPGKSTVCGYDTDGKQQQQQQQQQQRDNQSGVVRANIKRGKVYLVFVNRVGPRNFTILGEPVIRSKKNEQAVQAVVRPDYGTYDLPSTKFWYGSSFFCSKVGSEGGYVVRAQGLDSEVTRASETSMPNEGLSTPESALAERRDTAAPPQRPQDSTQTAEIESCDILRQTRGQWEIRVRS
ncbi:protein vein isoform X3 [Hylaeus anthracinus]|uniref:protein vein isoform X3 n=1 Tax=Hylaeus anthracinus TaxID=313031 RepID=UPI0023B95D8E|nr:protein vein isoform X3 [Hylaeus anthracinus]